MSDFDVSELTEKQQQFIRAMLLASTQAEAADVVGISLRTAQRYMNEPAVRKALDDAHNEALRQTARTAAARTADALDVLVRMMKDKAVADAVRRRAAKDVVDLALRFSEAVLLLERVEMLEQRMNGGDHDDQE